MAHLLESMFSVVETPWHKLGVILDAPPTTAEAIKVSGLDWNVEKKPLFLATGEKVEAFANVRTSDHSILANHVGPDYTLLQNRDAFAWFDPFLASGEATLETAGSLRDGAVVWVLARIGADSVIVPRSDDRVAKYLLLSNSHNGRESVRIGETPTRVVCANTLAMAHAKGNKLKRVKHTASMLGKLGAARALISEENEKFEKTAEKYRALARRQVSAREVAQVVSHVFEAPPVGFRDDDLMSELLRDRFATPEKEDRKMRNARERHETIVELFERGRGNDMPGVKGTAWALYNGVTEYLQYERPRSNEATRLDSLTFGDGAEKSERALDRLLEMVKH